MAEAAIAHRMLLKELDRDSQLRLDADGWVYHRQCRDVRARTVEGYPFEPPTIEYFCNGSWLRYIFTNWSPVMRLNSTIMAVNAEVLNPQTLADTYFEMAIEELDPDKSAYYFKLAEGIEKSIGRWGPETVAIHYVDGAYAVDGRRMTYEELREWLFIHRDSHKTL